MLVVVMGTLRFYLLGDQAQADYCAFGVASL